MRISLNKDCVEVAAGKDVVKSSLVLSGVILVYLLLVLLAVCILSKVCRHVATADLYGLCADLGMTCRQCCSCSCRCSYGYTCMQYAVDECLLLCRDCQYTCAHCRQICQDTNTAPCFRFSAVQFLPTWSSLIMLLQQLLSPPVFLQPRCYPWALLPDPLLMPLLLPSVPAVQLYLCWPGVWLCGLLLPAVKVVLCAWFLVLLTG